MTWMPSVWRCAAILAVIGSISLSATSKAGFTLSITEGSFTKIIGWGFTPAGGTNGGTNHFHGNELLSFGPTTFHDFSFSQITAISDSNNPAGNFHIADVSITILGLTGKKSTKSLIITATDTGFGYPFSSDKVLAAESTTVSPKGPSKLAYAGHVFNIHDSVVPVPFSLVLGPKGGSGSESEQSLHLFDPVSAHFTVSMSLTASNLGSTARLNGRGDTSLTATTPQPATMAMALAGLCVLGTARWLTRK